MNVLAMMTRKQKRYGGAERPLDRILVKAPMSLMMVGRKTGRDAKVTLHPKYMKAVMNPLC